MHFTQSRIWQWVAAAVVLVAVAVGVLRKVGLPMPEVILAYTTKGRMQQLAGDLIGWQLTLRFADGRPKAKLLYRGTGEKLRLVSGKYYDRKGNLRSRVADGHGVALLFHDNGNLAELVSYFQGTESEPHLRWSSEGELVQTPVTGTTNINSLR